MKILHFQFCYSRNEIVFGMKNIGPLEVSYMQTVQLLKQAV